MLEVSPLLDRIILLANNIEKKGKKVKEKRKGILRNRTNYSGGFICNNNNIIQNGKNHPHTMDETTLI